MGLSLCVYSGFGRQDHFRQTSSDTFFLHPQVSIETAIAATIVLLISGLFAD
jgi:hypothetical protein